MHVQGALVDEDRSETDCASKECPKYSLAVKVVLTKNLSGYGINV